MIQYVHIIWAIIFIIKLYKSVTNAPKDKIFEQKCEGCNCTTVWLEITFAIAFKT